MFCGLLSDIKNRFSKPFFSLLDSAFPQCKPAAGRPYVRPPEEEAAEGGGYGGGPARLFLRAAPSSILVLLLRLVPKLPGGAIFGPAAAAG